MTGAIRCPGRRHFRRFGIALVVGAGMLPCFAAPANAGISAEEVLKLASRIERGPIPTLKLPRATLKDSTRVANAPYGTENASIVSRLDRAKRKVTTAFDRTATRVAEPGDTETQNLIRECAQEATLGVAEKYQSAIANQSGYPNLDESFRTAVEKCLSGALPKTPVTVRQKIVALLTDQSHHAAEHALQSHPPGPAFAAWLQASADGIQNPVSPAPRERDGDPYPGGGGSSLPWVIGGIVLIALAGGGALALRARRRPR